MLELSIFCDESGGMNGTSRYRLVTLVFHDQSQDISPHIEAYERNLEDKGLPNIPFHTGPLMYGKGPYRDIDLADRRKMMASFAFFQAKLPFKYKTFAYRRSEFDGEASFMARFKRDLVLLLCDNLSFFQSFDQVKIYYDDGQRTISNALHAALEYELSKHAVMYRDASPADYRLSQVADYLCAIELIGIKFDAHEINATDEKFFGLSATTFKRDYLKKARRKLL